MLYNKKDNVTRYGGMRLSAVTGGKMENFRQKKIGINMGTFTVQ